MRHYNITITADRYPTTYEVQASNWATALARATRLWAKKFRGCRADTLKINAIKGGISGTIDEVKPVEPVDE